MPERGKEVVLGSSWEQSTSLWTDRETVAREGRDILGQESSLVGATCPEPEGQLLARDPQVGLNLAVLTLTGFPVPKIAAQRQGASPARG